MGNVFNKKNIGKSELSNINEDDVYFMTIPGRMGDEDGVNIIIKKDDEFICYRVSGLMYHGNNNDPVSFSDLETMFPKWLEAWNSKEDTSKYKKIYMGFGNQLCIDNRIYDKFMPYLMDAVKNNIIHDEMILENGEYNPAIYYSSWEDAFNNMVNDK